MGRLLVVAAAALILAGAASAATIDDLRALGYTVSLSNAGPADGSCPTYFVSGHGANVLVNCNSQDIIAALANPLGVCNADWQANHHDQYEAFQTISGKGWVISGDQCGDKYTVTNPNDGTAAYSGSGAGLPSFAQTHDAPPAGTVAPGAKATPPPQTCLPLCSTPPPVVLIETPNGPQPLTVTASSAIASITDPALAPAVAAILFPDRSGGYLVRAGYGTAGALTP